ncbi:MAG: hypothetical protein ABIO99_07205, partial [Candidatus Limnocylindria bacterium]
MSTNDAATASRVVDDRKTRRTMLVQRSTRLRNRFCRAATGGSRPHDLGDRHVRGSLLVGGQTAAHVALGD